jgi:hypothetical protein
MVIGVGAVGIDPDCLVVVGDRSVVLAFFTSVYALIVMRKAVTIAIPILPAMKPRS